MSTTLSTRVAADLHQHLTEVCAVAGLPADNAVLIKYTMNAVYRIGSYVVRLNHGEHARRLAQTTTAAVLTLTRKGVPLIEPATDLTDKPICTGNWVATVWKYVPTVDADPLPIDLAVPLRALHAINDLGIPLPTWDPINKFRRRISNAAAHTGHVAAEIDQWARTELSMPATRLIDILYGWCDDLHTELANIDWHLPPGPTHGDAHTGNLLLRQHPRRPSPDPTALICDPDGLCNGPREWDLLPTAHGTTRFGRPRADYDTFAAAYGFDLLTWTGWPTLRRLREVQVVTSVIDTFPGRPALATQLALRLRSLLNEDTTAIWTRYT
ncbi:phosphotransferase [Paractinoplanes rishiriensis]|uniref:Aminoglycoside phosphotransferase n=1 Tax=Paractinoplanes rishiriensis TaxID=1050105 RepID=A0A919MZ71_9ACTN|nr:phosphotransferase [Actinoplanes rishiriensis]GIF01124.1 aminoglycoside phosphotransferase [Actinoplanes rishiriensis]